MVGVMKITFCKPDRTREVILKFIKNSVTPVTDSQVPTEYVSTDQMPAAPEKKAQ